MPIEDTSRFSAQTMLGFRVQSNLRLVEKIENGLPYAAFERLAKKTGIPVDRLRAVAGIAPRTFSRRKEEKKFSRSESDRIVSLSRLFAQAIELFEGNTDEARIWLSSPNHAFTGRTPLDIAVTEAGTREVEKLIGRLEHGVFT